MNKDLTPTNKDAILTLNINFGAHVATLQPALITLLHVMMQLSQLNVNNLKLGLVPLIVQKCKKCFYFSGSAFSL